MAINKFQRSSWPLSFQPRSLILWSHQYYENIAFSQTIGPIELKFHVKTPYDKLAKICTKYIGHMTKMAATPIYGKNLLKIFFFRTRRPVTLRLGMQHWGCGAYQVCSNDDPRLTLTYLTSRSNLLPNAFKCFLFFLNVVLLNTV